MGAKHFKSLLVLFMICAAAASSSWQCEAAPLAPALFVLGDSSVDTGNQNYITSVLKSNYPPYGQNFVPPGPTGRFSNGKLANDFLADYLGIPSPVNYLAADATGSKLLTGVNLASSGSGILDITGQIFGVLNLTRQLDNLGLVKAQIFDQIGEPATTTLFNNAVYLISTGSNDYINNYNINPVIQSQYNPAQYKQHLYDTVRGNLQRLYNYGARIVVVNSLGPLGCCPQQLALYQSKDGKCLDWVNAQVQDFNVGLKSLLFQLRGELPGYQLIYGNCYDLLFDMISNYQNYGYNANTTTACCGEGTYRAAPCVNPISDVCSNPDEAIFWDLFHPSQRTFQYLADAAWSGGPDSASPTNLQSIL